MSCRINEFEESIELMGEMDGELEFEGFEAAFENGGYGQELDGEDMEGAGELEFEVDEGWEAEADDEWGETGTEMEMEFDEGGEYGWEADDEMESFFKSIGRFAKRAGKGLMGVIKKGARAVGRIAGPVFKQLGPLAARIVGGAIGGPVGAKIGGAIASAVLREAELESYGDSEAELAGLESAIGAAGGSVVEYREMEYEAARASTARSAPARASALQRMLQRAARMHARNPKLRPVIPRVVKGGLALAASLGANPKTRWAVRLVPVIIARTFQRLARAPKVDPQAVVVAMSRETAWVLANRSRATAGLKRHRTAVRSRVVRRGGPIPRPRVRVPAR